MAETVTLEQDYRIDGTLYPAGERTVPDEVAAQLGKLGEATSTQKQAANVVDVTQGNGIDLSPQSETLTGQHRVFEGKKLLRGNNSRYLSELSAGQTVYINRLNSNQIDEVLDDNTATLVNAIPFSSTNVVVSKNNDANMVRGVNSLTVGERNNFYGDRGVVAGYKNQQGNDDGLVVGQENTAGLSVLAERLYPNSVAAEEVRLDGDVVSDFNFGGLYVFNGTNWGFLSLYRGDMSVEYDEGNDETVITLNSKNLIWSLNANNEFWRGGNGTYELGTVIGLGNVVTRRAGIAAGIGNMVGVENGMALGAHARCRISGAIALATGGFGHCGDAQTHIWNGTARTTNATPTGLENDIGFLTSGLIDLEINSQYMVEGYVQALKDEIDESAAYKVECLVRVGATFATASIVYQDVTATHEDDATWTVAFATDVVGDFWCRLKVNVTGAAGKNLRWLGALKIHELKAPDA